MGMDQLVTEVGWSRQAGDRKPGAFVGDFKIAVDGGLRKVGKLQKESSGGWGRRINGRIGIGG